MAKDRPQEQRRQDERERDRDCRTATPASPQSGPSPFNDGPELIRDNHC